MSLKAVLFDLDNTLIDRDGALSAALYAEFEPSRAQELLALADHHRLLELWQVTQGQLVERLCRYLEPSPCLQDWLRSLQRRHKVALVSNGASASQRAKLKASGLDQIFAESAIFISEEVGVSKPSPKIFQRALDLLEVQPSESIYLGDRPEIDGAGARAAGLRFLHVSKPLC